MVFDTGAVGERCVRWAAWRENHGSLGVVESLDLVCGGGAGRVAKVPVPGGGTKHDSVDKVEGQVVNALF